MDLPVTPKWFRKAELYEELRRQQKRGGEHEHWLLEKAFLRWAESQHFHLGKYFTKADFEDTIWPRIIELARGYREIEKHEVVLIRTMNLMALTPRVMENLVEHGWAEPKDPEDINEGIKVNRTGMLMAEVLTDSERPVMHGVYVGFRGLVWALVLSAAVLTLSAAAGRLAAFLEWIAATVPRLLAAVSAECLVRFLRLLLEV